MTKEQRPVHGPRALASLLPAITRPALRHRNAASAQIVADWELIAGPRLAALTLPRRLSAGTLTLACAGPTALELQHQSQMLIGRINTHFGRLLVDRLRFIQDDTALAFPHAQPTSHAAASPAATGLGTVTPVVIPDMPEGPLRDALAALGGRIAARRRG